MEKLTDEAIKEFGLEIEEDESFGDSEGTWRYRNPKSFFQILESKENKEKKLELMFEEIMHPTQQFKISNKEQFLSKIKGIKEKPKLTEYMLDGIRIFYNRETKVFEIFHNSETEPNYIIWDLEEEEQEEMIKVILPEYDLISLFNEEAGERELEEKLWNEIDLLLEYVSEIDFNPIKKKAVELSMKKYGAKVEEFKTFLEE